MRSYEGTACYYPMTNLKDTRYVFVEAIAILALYSPSSQSIKTSQ